MSGAILIASGLVPNIESIFIGGDYIHFRLKMSLAGGAGQRIEGAVERRQEWVVRAGGFLRKFFGMTIWFGTDFIV